MVLEQTPTDYSIILENQTMNHQTRSPLRIISLNRQSDKTLIINKP
ncbi:hypothetical protein [Coleofasciculus sp. E2-BRE-01]